MKTLFRQLRQRPSRGIALIEALVYIALAVVLFAVVMKLLLAMSLSFIEAQVSRNLVAAGSTALERIVRSAREAESVATTTSILGTSPGKLVLNTSSSTTLTFGLDASSTLYVQQDSGALSPLFGEGVFASNLVFRYINASSSQAVKIELTVQNSTGRRNQSLNFYDTVVVRGSYQ